MYFEKRLLTAFWAYVEFASPLTAKTKNEAASASSLTNKQVICVGAPVFVAKPCNT